MTRIYVYNKTREIINGGRVLPAKGGDQNVYNAFRAFAFGTFVIALIALMLSIRH